ncbi:MAG: DUF2934 domain-containing protein [Terriglobales bacterium]
MNANPPKKSPTSVASKRQDIELDDQIRLRAYELYVARGHQGGHEMEDWLQAEAELTEGKVRPIAA